MSYQDHMTAINASFNTLPSGVKPAVAAIKQHASEMQVSRIQHVKRLQATQDDNQRARLERAYQQQRAADQARSAELLAQAHQAIAAHEAQAAEREAVMTPAMKFRASAASAFVKPLDVNNLSGLLGSVEE